MCRRWVMLIIFNLKQNLWLRRILIGVQFIIKNLKIKLKDRMNGTKFWKPELELNSILNRKQFFLTSKSIFNGFSHFTREIYLKNWKKYSYSVVFAFFLDHVVNLINACPIFYIFLPTKWSNTFQGNLLLIFYAMCSNLKQNMQSYKFHNSNIFCNCRMFDEKLFYKKLF